ncbi:Acetylornithine deacetylase/Succinyl-diaminopimelate desuccinylase [Methylomagnum ishizawai]|uniref:Acetylornithine deacetylase/Succinyl-diaminopimelate desuccinylase n=1 Tax=Methylomagnum ishizawai TaxID=1760988 RepID=A0A1Y6CZZ7_9GAMM|nr:M20/M25/M40 family metallo-hydrolase [Methylomagnum ishizawai]SMF95967.1 Acetylornithine deacetylase/Succinyl-diaminopimelate desuccinylase [Methylomagnum ishizawai]
MIATDTLYANIAGFWDREIVPTLAEYIKIPNKSPHFDPDWAAHGHMEAARRLALDWLAAHPLPGAILHDTHLPGRTPLILLEVPGTLDKTVLIYGHLDKQPEMEGWSQGLGPWTPVLREDKLYGRGGADDGYALFAAVAALRALAGVALPRIVILIEFSEESGSPDLPAYLDAYGGIIDTPDLVIALDSGAGDYERLWSTTSLRGVVNGVVDVKVLEETAHSGIASGIVPSSMRIMRQLLDRLEDPVTGASRIPALLAEIPEQRRQQAAAAAEIIGVEGIRGSFKVVPGLCPVSADGAELLLNNTWRPTLCVVGQAGMPPIHSAGNILRSHTAFKLSIRLPPTVDGLEAEAAIRAALTADPPYDAEISVEFDQSGTGWNAPALAPWLEQATQEASGIFYGKDAAYVGLGGSIPFMGMLGQQFPEAQFLITGVLGPLSNAHGPNEFLHIPYAKKLTACVAYILAKVGA